MIGRIPAVQESSPGLIPEGVISGGGPDVLMITDSDRSALMLLSSVLVDSLALPTSMGGSPGDVSEYPVT